MREVLFHQPRCSFTVAVAQRRENVGVVGDTLFHSYGIAPGKLEQPAHRFIYGGVERAKK